MESIELKDMGNWVSVDDIRVIQKSRQEQKKCHHLQMILRESHGINILTVAGTVVRSLPKQLCLVLSLSIRKQDRKN